MSVAVGLRIGLLLHSDFGGEPSPSWRGYLRRYVGCAEESGFDGIFVPTEIGIDRFHLFAILGALAAWTEKMTVGTCVLLLPLYGPLDVAEAAVTAQVLSGGRVALGVGLGWQRSVFEASGVSFESRLGRLREHLATLPGLLAGERVDFDGEHFHLAGSAVGAARGLPHTPIWLGSHSPAGIERAARHADAWIAGSFRSTATLARQAERYRSALEQAGRSFQRLVLVRECCVAATREAAWNDAAWLHGKLQEYASRVGAMPFDPAAAIESIAPRRFAIGTPSDCVDVLVSAVEATGATDLILRTQYRGTDQEAALRGLALLGREVLPEVRLRVAALGRPGPSVVGRA